MRGLLANKGKKEGSHLTNEFSTSWHSYPSIYALGHRALANLLTEPVLVEEKVDGSQFSFGRFNEEFRARSKGATLNTIAPEAMFIRACEETQQLDLHDGWTYRGEYLAKPKHNVLVYSRIPIRHVILFDINSGHEDYLNWDEKATEAERIGLEVVPRLFEGTLEDPSILRGLLATTSVLGGQLIEGVVVKSHSLYGTDEKLLMGKFVSESFKEVHSKIWKAENPGSRDILDRLIETYHSQARWQKAVQHLRESGQLEGSPHDIGLLMKEVGPDVLRECEQEIRDYLMKWAWPHVQRGITKGLPEWYKEQLLASQFEI